MTLEEPLPKATVRAILPDALVTVVNVERHGSNAFTITYSAPDGQVAEEILYRHDEAMDTTRVASVREEMERDEAQRRIGHRIPRSRSQVERFLDGTPIILRN